MTTLDLLQRLTSVELETLPTNVLLELQTKVSRVLSKREDRNAIVILKEWADKDHQRRVSYRYERGGSLALRGVMEIYDGSKRLDFLSATHNYCDSSAKCGLRKGMKLLLSEMGVKSLRDDGHLNDSIVKPSAVDDEVVM